MYQEDDCPVSAQAAYDNILNELLQGVASDLNSKIVTSLKDIKRGGILKNSQKSQRATQSGQKLVVTLKSLIMRNFKEKTGDDFLQLIQRIQFYKDKLEEADFGKKRQNYDKLLCFDEKIEFLKQEKEALKKIYNQLEKK